MSYQTWKTGVSLSLHHRLDPEELTALKSAGVDCVELSFWLDEFYDKLAFPQKAEYYRDMAARAGIEFWSIHLPFGSKLDVSEEDQRCTSPIMIS